ncbi:MAG: fumarylacetoacetate hydrolase family protein [Anaerolineaceae bacterium]|nr:fumarylacetoacetate hydrolase family protein [Anaerolineaceae bacterium]
MRFVRYLAKDDIPRYGWILDDRVGPIEGTPFGDFRRLEADFELKDVKLLAPVVPEKIIGIGRNYIEHAKEHGANVPDSPMMFLKPPSAVIGPNDYIELPPQSQQVEHEGELVIVIGKEGRWIKPDEVSEYILGYTIGNDVTARDLQRRDGQWARGKGFDTFCPLGPWIETDLDPLDVLITCRVNEEMRQMASSRDMVFSIVQLVAFASTVMTLKPGDVIMTGTPAGVGIMNPGDEVEINIEGIGTLNNPVK